MKESIAVYMPSLYAPPHKFRGPEKSVSNLTEGLMKYPDIRRIVVDCAKTDFPPPHLHLHTGVDVYGDDNPDGAPNTSSFPTSAVIDPEKEHALAQKFIRNQREVYGTYFDIIHTITMYPRVLEAAIASKTQSGAPIIVSPRGSDTPHHNPEYEYGDTQYWKKLASSADYFAPNSSLIGREIEALGIENAKEKIVVIPNAINTQRIEIVKRNREPAAQIEAVYFGRLVGVKRVHLIVEAIRKAIDDGIDINLEIMGYGKESETIRKKIDDLGLHSVVTCTGKPYIDSQIPELIRNKNLYITASSNEGTPHSTLEAMACAKAVMTTKEGGGEDFFEGEEDPLSISVDDAVNDMVRKFRLIKNHPDLLTEEGWNNRWLSRTKFTWERVIGSYHDLYERALGEQK